MAGTSSTRPEFVPVSLKAVIPVIPTEDDESKQLIEDMTKMGCEGLLAEPWAVKSETMVQEFQHPRSNEWEGTIRRDPNHWTADMWADVYGFRKEGMMRAGRTGTWVDGKFRQDINSKDGYAVSDCINPREAGDGCSVWRTESIQQNGRSHPDCDQTFGRLQGRKPRPGDKEAAGGKQQRP